MAKAFCPNCGTENEGTPGMRLTCIACTASFEVPRDTSWVGPTQATPSKPPVATTQPPPVARPTVAPGYTGPSPGGSLSGGGSFGNGGGYNTLAIVSLVLGIVCCIPFSGIGAIVTGVMAQNQIATSGERGKELAIAGIVLGGLSVALTLLSFVVSAFSH